MNILSTAAIGLGFVAGFHFEVSAAELYSVNLIDKKSGETKMSLVESEYKNETSKIETVFGKSGRLRSVESSFAFHCMMESLSKKRGLPYYLFVNEEGPPRDGFSYVRFTKTPTPNPSLQIFRDSDMVKNICSNMKIEIKPSP